MNNTIHRMYFLIEGPGKALDLVKAFVNERSACLEASRAFALKVGAESYRSNRDTGEIIGLSFGVGGVPRSWKSVGNTGRRGGVQLYRPRHGSDEQREMASLPKISITSSVISSALDIPVSISFVDESGNYAGGAILATPGEECGFAFPSHEGPYLLWIPDIAKACAAVTGKGSVAERAGAKLADGLADYAPSFEGCRQILSEEWDLIVAQHNFEAAKKAAAV